MKLPKSIQTVEDYFHYVREVEYRTDKYISWVDRVKVWKELNIELLAYTEGKLIKSSRNNKIVMPVFPQVLNNIEEDTIMLEKTKQTAENIIDQNKEAGLLAAELTVGRTANEFLMKKVVKTLPFWKRWIFGDNHWLGKLMISQAANALIQQTSPSDKLKTIGNAMIKESLVEATVYSDQVTNLINGLEDAVSMPFLDKLMDKK